jgi:hypothetical protein
MGLFPSKDGILSRFLLVRVSLYANIVHNFSDRGITLHTPIESPGRADKKYVVIKNVNCDLGPKKA